MALITIEEVRAENQDDFQATVSFNHGARYHLTLHNPFTPEQERELEWYFEEHLRFPFTEKVRASNAATSIRSYGESLFNQVFTDRQAYSSYKTCLQAGLTTLQIEVAGSPALHSLHWEALKDPDLPTPLSLQATMVRKNLLPSSLEAQVRLSPTLNLLIVTARPSGKHDVGYRTISRPLVDLLRQSDLPVQIELLRPGTYEALDQHLQKTTNQHGVGYYQVIHFDVHGAVLSFAEFQQVQQEQGNRYLFQNRYGRSDIAAYEGDKAFLFFEETKQNKSDPVEASELANLLLAHQVPVAILNACQSGKQIGASETSLGSRLMQAGVQLVLAMGYSVTVTAAELLMRTLYRELFAKHELSTAISMARRELHNRKERRVYYNQTLDLEDWLLPVIYQNKPVQLNTRPLTPEESLQLHERNASRYAPTQPTYGFVGRDLDILQIEKRLLTRRNILLIRGMGGAGKTTLLHHLASWWQTTQFIREVFYFGYDEKAWSRQQIITKIAQQLMSKIEYLTTFQPLSLDAQQSLLAGKLRATPHLLILDNLESITGARLAIQHTLTKKEQAALHHFLKDLAGGQTMVLLGSRGGETWLSAETFVDNVYDLPGLDEEAASALAERILERTGATKYRQDKHLPTLLTTLDGFPLALEVVLANLSRQTPEEVLKALQVGDVDLNVGDSQKRTQNILRCIDYSNSNLSPAAQALLTCLAPFTSVLFTNVLEGYSAHLKAQVALAHLPFDRWQAVLQEAINWGLLSPDPKLSSYLRLQPIFPYFLRTRLNAPEQDTIRQAVNTAFLALYNEWGMQLYDLLNSKEPQQRQTGLVLAQYEYENLLSAVNRALAADTSILVPYSVLSDYFDMMQAPQQGLEVAQEVWKHLKSLKTAQPQDQLNTQLSKVLDDLGRWEMQLKQYTQAEQYYQLKLAYSNLREQAVTYHQLGMVAEEQRQFAQAEQYFQQALQLKIEFNDRYSQASTYHQLGRMAQEQRQFTQAEQYFQQALQICVEFKVRYEQARIYHNLGIVAREQQQFAQAEQYYQQALQLFVEFNDRYSQAGTYHNLGTVAQEQLQFAQAEQYYQQALQIYVEFNDRYSQARTYHQLGIVAQEQLQFAQAEQYYQQALQLKIEFNDRYSQANTYGQLGRVAEEQQQWELARTNFLQSLDIFTSYDDTHSSQIVLRGLARVWKSSGDTTLPSAVASTLQCSREEAETLLRDLLGDGESKSGEQAQ